MQTLSVIPPFRSCEDKRIPHKLYWAPWSKDKLSINKRHFQFDIFAFATNEPTETQMWSTETMDRKVPMLSCRLAECHKIVAKTGFILESRSCISHPHSSLWKTMTGRHKWTRRNGYRFLVNNHLPCALEFQKNITADSETPGNIQS